MSGKGPPERLRALLGADPMRDLGTLHIAAVWEDPDGGYQNLRVGDGAPTTDDDAWLLAGARARADAIVTTGAILRDEPALVHTLAAPGDGPAELQRWRVEGLGKTRPPTLAVLTGSGRISLSHPAISAAQHVCVYTGGEGARTLKAGSGVPPHVEIIELVRPGVMALIGHQRQAHGARTVLVEAGPSTAAHLYHGAGAVDELLLSVLQADYVRPADLGPMFIAPQAIQAVLGAPIHRVRRIEASGPWTTLRHRRSAQAPVSAS